MDARTRMKAWREALGLTKLEFAGVADVWPSQVTMWESDKYKLNPSHRAISNVCAYAKIKPSRFYFGALPKPKKNKRARA